MSIVLKIEIDTFEIHKDNKLVEQVPAFIYIGDEGGVAYGKAAYRARGIYPESVYSLSHAIVYNDINMIRELARFIDKYIKLNYNDEHYSILFNVYANEALNAAFDKYSTSVARILNNDSQIYVMKRGIYDLSISNNNGQQLVGDSELIIYLDNIIANKITNIAFDTYGSLSRAYFLKLKRVIMKSIHIYKKDLLNQGYTLIKTKLIDDNFFVHQITVQVNAKDVYNDDEIQQLKSIDIRTEEIVRRAVDYKLVDNNFKVTFISPFSYGKSTILNAMIGDSLLKMDIRAETAVITKVCSSEMNKVLIKYRDKKIKQLDYKSNEELKDILQNQTGVRSNGVLPEEITVLYKLENLPGITLVDAPGLFSPYKDHNLIAYKAMSISDLVLFLINPSRIGDKNFTEKIKQYLPILKRHNKEFAFVLSKYDLYEPDTEVIVDEFNKVLDVLNIEHSSIFFVSGYFAMIGRQLKNSKIDIDSVRKIKDLFVLENEDFLSGRKLERHHFSNLIEFSQIERLESYILQRSEEFGLQQDSLDYRQQEIC